MTARSAWGLAVLFFASGVKSLDTPPPELLENLEFFKSMDLLLEDDSTAPKKVKPKARPGKEKGHASTKSK